MATKKVNNKQEQLNLGLTGFKKKSYPPAEVKSRVIGIKAARDKRISEKAKEERDEQVYRVLNRAGLQKKVTVRKVVKRIKDLEEDIKYHQDQVSMNNTASDIKEAREHKVILKDKQEIVDNLKKLINAHTKRRSGE